MSDHVSETKRGQIPSIDVLEGKLQALQNAIERGREAEAEFPIVHAKLEALLQDPEYRARLAAKAERMKARAAKLSALANSL